MTDVAALRSRLKWSQPQMAAFLGVRQPSVSRMESGQPVPGPARNLILRLEALVDSEIALPGMPVDVVLQLAIGRSADPKNTSALEPQSA